MAQLRRISGGAPFTIPAEALLGRSPSCALRVDDPYASGQHAKISWTGTKWTLRDLGSSNGTFVDGVRLEPGAPHVLMVGARVGLGDEQGSLEIVDLGAPVAMGVDLADQRTQLATGDVLLLPSDEAPEASVYPASDGTGWVIEDADGETRSVGDQSVVTVAGRTFRLDLPVVSEATPLVDAKMTLPNVTFRFGVTRDEEQAEVTIVLRGIGTVLERREYAYLLLNLARCRRDDDAKPVDERGWRTVDDLQKMLRMERNALNVAVHRARQALASAGLEGAAGIVETRPGERRLGTDRFEIFTLEG